MRSGSAVGEHVHGVIERFDDILVFGRGGGEGVYGIVRASAGTVADVEVDAAETILGAGKQPVEPPECGSEGVAHARHAAARGGVGFGESYGQLAFVRGG